MKINSTILSYASTLAAIILIGCSVINDVGETHYRDKNTRSIAEYMVNHGIPGNELVLWARSRKIENKTAYIVPLDDSKRTASGVQTVASLLREYRLTPEIVTDHGLSVSDWKLPLGKGINTSGLVFDNLDNYPSDALVVYITEEELDDIAAGLAIGINIVLNSKYLPIIHEFYHTLGVDHCQVEGCVMFTTWSKTTNMGELCSQHHPEVQAKVSELYDCLK